MEDQDLRKYPEGYETVKSMLGFLPDIEPVRENFMMTLLEFLIQH